MCGNLAINKELNRDPTQTKVLRQSYSAEMYKRFRQLKGLLRTTILDNDAFRLTDKRPTLLNANASPKKHFSGTPAEQMVEFEEWLQSVIDEIILEAKQSNTQSWQNSHIRAGFVKGVNDAQSNLKVAGIEIQTLFGTISLTKLLQMPSMQNRLNILYQQNFAELKGITDVMSQQIKRELAQGMAQGKHPREIARLINDRVDKIGITRSRALARTEIIRAHAEGSLTTYELYGIEQVGAKVEHSTAGDDRVCSICKSLEGQVYTIAEARGRIPVHPNCRCAWIPIINSQ